MIQAHLVPTVEGFNQRLREAVLECERLNPGASLAPSKGWSSPKRFFTKEIAALLMFARGLDARINVGRVEVWANITRKSEPVDLHDHIWSTGRKHRNTVSGVYYPHDSEASISFPDFGLSVTPRKGLLLLFSPEDKHCVETAASERISIAFNAH